MNWQRLLLGLVLFDFAAFTGWVVYEHGYLGFFELATANGATQLLFFDFLIALALVSVWMVRDARTRGVGYLPYLALTAVFGSAGPLLYLIRRPASA